MSLTDCSIGVGFTGSFCTFSHCIEQLKNLSTKADTVYPVFSYHAKTLDTRFGNAKDFLATVQSITGQNVITTIPDAEPFGPKLPLDLFVILPCTGNTLSKLALGITDTPVLMAAKAHLRNQKPLVIALASNDSLGASMKNIGLLMNSKNIYFVPLKQDDPIHKPNSLVCDFTLLEDTINLALENKQLQPVLLCS